MLLFIFDFAFVRFIYLFIVNFIVLSFQEQHTCFLNDTSDGKTFSIVDYCNKFCIVCKKIARSGSVYCSDECIAKHSQDALMPTNLENPCFKSEIMESKVNFTSVNANLDTEIQTVKNKEYPVTVFEKSKNRYLTGENAPTAQNLKQWLQDHPTFQVVTPATSQVQIESTKEIIFSKPTKNETKLNTGATLQRSIASPKELSEIKVSILKSPTTQITSTSTPLHSKHNSVGKFSHEKDVGKKLPNNSPKTMPGSKDSREHDIIRLKSKEGLQVRRLL